MKKKLGFWEIWNMSFGFLGIQFGFALQGGFMSRIFQTLGVEEASIPLLWIAAPLTGLIVQPIIGYLSDNTWHPLLGRRKPYFLIGAILSSITLFFVPYSSTLWMAAGFLWILDASINISMEPFRALVADKLPDSQRSYGFVTQTLVIGIGTWIASNLPYFVSSLGVSDVALPGVIPDSDPSILGPPLAVDPPPADDDAAHPPEAGSIRCRASVGRTGTDHRRVVAAPVGSAGTAHRERAATTRAFRILSYSAAIGRPCRRTEVASSQRCRPEWGGCTCSAHNVRIIITPAAMGCPCRH